jgi:cyclopropane fatty-acyl-phospholipid synthase-like methyltransferase
MDPRKRLVRDCYDAVGDAYAESARRRPIEYPKDAERERLWYERFVAMLPDGARVLDLGCGNGESYLGDLCARGFRAVGVDLSHRQAVRAHARCPHAVVVEGDMAEVEFAGGVFDGVLSYHAIWNLPRQEHAAVFARVRRWLAVGGVALLTMAEVPANEWIDGPGMFTDLLGVPTFYDAHQVDVPLALVTAAGFDVVDCHEPDPHDRSTGVLMILVRAR